MIHVAYWNGGPYSARISLGKCLDLGHWIITCSAVVEVSLVQSVKCTQSPVCLSGAQKKLEKQSRNKADWFLKGNKEGCYQCLSICHWYQEILLTQREAGRRRFSDYASLMPPSGNKMRNPLQRRGGMVCLDKDSRLGNRKRIVKNGCKPCLVIHLE